MFSSFILSTLLLSALSKEIYKSRNIPYDNLNDDMNNVGEGGEDGVLGWGEIFREEYEDEKRKEQMEADLDADEGALEGGMGLVEGWPAKPLLIGQVGGLAVDSNGLLHVLHRAERRWEKRSFDNLNQYTGERRMIDGDTVLVVNGTDGMVVDKWGSNRFSMPHGLHIDEYDNIYITDVALHQVFRFKAGQRSPDLTLGHAYQPAASNDDKQRFCQPTDVAVAANGDFYVADGYCNSRVVKYSREGTVVGVFGEDDSNVPHSLALVQESDMLCVADREGMRVLCYRAGLKDASSLGAAVSQYIHPRVGPVYAITYNTNASLVYGVTGRAGDLKGRGFSLDVQGLPQYPSDFVSFWSPSYHADGDEGEDEEGDDEGEDDVDDDGSVKEFTNPHAIASKGGEVYVGETGPDIVWKFQRV